MPPLEESDRDLAIKVRRILLTDWDPIGISQEPAAQDEYDSYVPKICRLLHSGADATTIAAMLERIEKHRMGLKPSAGRDDAMRHRLQVADALLRLRDEA